MYSKVYIEITNTCNLHCSFCHGHKRKARQMTEAEFSFLLDKLSGVTEYVYYHLMGEPLCHPELPAFIRLAGARGYKSVITTNGTLLSQRGKEIVEAHPHKVNISLHSFENGTEEAHARYVKEAADFAKAASACGIITVFRLWNENFDQKRNEEAYRILRESIEGEWAQNTRGIRIRDKIHLEWGERFDWPDAKAEIKGNSFFCYGLRDHFGILSDGTVVPCCLDSDGVIALGNIFTEDLSEILSSARAKAITCGFSRGEAAEDLCRRCGYAQKFI